MPFEIHNPDTVSWRTLPHRISPVTWFVHYHVLQDFLDTFRRELSNYLDFNRRPTVPLYIHGVVKLPFTIIPHAVVRHEVYNMFLRNTPLEFINAVSCMRFRLLFVGTPEVGDMISIDQLRFRTSYTESLYSNELYFER